MATHSSAVDQYQRVQIQGVSSVNDSSPLNVWIDPTTNRTLVDATVSASVPTASPNPSVELGYNAAGQLVRIRKVIGVTTYTKLITGTDISDTAVASTKTFGVWT